MLMWTARPSGPSIHPRRLIPTDNSGPVIGTTQAPQRCGWRDSCGRVRNLLHAPRCRSSRRPRLAGIRRGRRRRTRTGSGRGRCDGSRPGAPPPSASASQRNRGEVMPRRVLVLLAVIVFATLMFGIGAAVEKASAGTTSTVVHHETPGGETRVAEPPAATANNQEAIFGINPESPPLIVTATAGSIAVVAAVWLYWRRSSILWAGGAVMPA